MTDTNLFSSKRSVFVLVLLLLCSFFTSKQSILSISNHGSITEKEKAPPEKAPPPPPPADIAINRNSPYTLSDVTRITHIPSETRIEVHLNATRRCQNPVFKGRISGWSLSMIEFDTVSISDNVVTGKYDLFHMPRSGKYYVEILLVLCEGYGDAYQFLNLRNVSLEVNQDGRHQITAGNGNATIDIDIDVNVPNQHLTNQATKFRGRWLHKSLVTIQNTLVTDENLSQPVPLFTAVQCKATQCQDMNTRKTAFDQYTFLWNSGPDAVLNQPGISGMIRTQQINITEPPNHIHSTDVCFVGASHSRELTAACNGILKTTREIAEREKLDSPLLDGFDCRQFVFQFPSIPRRRKTANAFKYLTEDKIANIGRSGCTHVVVGLFQWYFSYENVGDPDVTFDELPNATFDEWKSGMTKVVQFFRALNHSSIRKVYLRSAHPNGFNIRHTRQPPKDWRTPVNSKLATQILQEIVNELETTSTSKNESKQLPLISFMDTDVVMDPVWESAQDWSHYKGPFCEAETKFILSTIMNDDRYDNTDRKN